MSRPLAIVTGAGRGIGRAVAIELAQRGYALALVSRTESELRQTQALCGGDEAMVLPLDVRDPAAIRAGVATITARQGAVEALVNNAGIAPLAPFDQTDAAMFDDVIATNLGATYHFSRAVWEGMAARRSGVIVNVSSEAARDPFPGFSIYAAAKGGINLFTKALAKEGDRLGIRVHAVAPAGVETAALRAIASTDVIPSADTLTPADVARVIAQCVVGDLAHTSGETIYLHKRV